MKPDSRQKSEEVGEEDRGYRGVKKKQRKEVKGGTTYERFIGQETWKELSRRKR